jgi:hypothetical protein
MEGGLMFQVLHVAAILSVLALTLLATAVVL